MAVLFAVTTLGNALLVGCGGGQQATPEGGSNAPVSGTTTPPTGGTPAGGDLGAKVYAERCVLCHGPEGKGDGAGAAGLDPKPRNHTDGAYMNAQSDEALINVIKNGKGNMPAWGSILSDEEINAVLKHVRSLAQPPYPG
jgi:mono/diheme cytochrome c family protein